MKKTDVQGAAGLVMMFCIVLGVVCLGWAAVVAVWAAGDVQAALRLPETVLVVLVVLFVLAWLSEAASQD